MPEARDRAERESLEMLVDLGNVCLRRRRMQAAGGSKSEEVVVVLVVVVLDLVGGAVAAVSVSVDCCSVVVVVIAEADAVGCSSVMVVGFSVVLSAMIKLFFDDAFYKSYFCLCV